MAVAECKGLAALLSLAAALLLFLLDHHGSSRLRADLLLAALDRLRGVDFIGLATRRNMVLLCHAILLLLLRDAGLLGSPVDTAGASCYSPTERSLAVVWRPRHRAAAAKRHRRGTRLAVAVEGPCAAPSLAKPEQQGAQHQSTKEIIHAEEHATYHHLLALAAEPDQPADCKTTTPSQLDLADDEGNVAEEGELQHEYGQEEDLDEMNRRFEAFIADTKKKMLLEAGRCTSHEE